MRSKSLDSIGVAYFVVLQRLDLKIINNNHNRSIY